MAEDAGAARFRGLRLAMDDASAVHEAAALFPALFPVAPSLSNDACFEFQGGWVQAAVAQGDALDVRCRDLAVQRRHLHRLGIQALDGAELGGAPCLRLDAIDTGAAAVNLRDGDGDGDGDGGRERHAAAPPVALNGLQLAVMAPERVALHWAQLFHARPLRDAQGLPTLALGGFTLRFAPAEGRRRGVSALEFGVRDLEQPLRHAASRGMPITSGTSARGAAFRALGIEFRLQPLS